MPPSGLPTGTVSSGRDGPSVPSRGHGGDVNGDAADARRVDELERENEALRAAVVTQRRENERIVERYERLLERERTDGPGPDATTTDAAGAPGPTGPGPAADDGVLGRVARYLGLR